VITTLLLDVDGVLVFGSPEFAATMDREYAWRDGIRAFMAELGRHPGEEASLVGHGDVLTLTTELLPAHVTDLDPQEFLDRWFAEDIVVNRELVELLAQSKFEAIYLATNQDRVRGKYIADMFATEPWLDGCFASYALGCAKPDPEFFRIALARIGVQPQECLFIDDKLKYLTGAASIGITTIHYRDLTQVTVELRDLGLLA
jgi:putative hydrolase of the HAD superfamily